MKPTAGEGVECWRGPQTGAGRLSAVSIDSGSHALAVRDSFCLPRRLVVRPAILFDAIIICMNIHRQWPTTPMGREYQ